MCTAVVSGLGQGLMRSSMSRVLVASSSVSRYVSLCGITAFSTNTRCSAQPQLYTHIPVQAKSPLAKDINNEIQHVSRRGIRQELLDWQDDNQGLIFPTTELRKLERGHQVSNSLLKGQQDVDDFEITDEDELFDGSIPFTAEDLVNFGDERPFLLCGDLVELRSLHGSRIEFAIFVRELETQAQFYTMSGKWLHQRSQYVKFFVPRFVDPSELETLIEFLPDNDVPEALQNKLQNFDYALPRDRGAPLVRKMLQFWKDSDTAYRSVASQLDNAHNIVADEADVRHASLVEIANELVPQAQRSDGEFPPHILYAVHRCLMQNDIGFRAQSKGNHRAWGQYEISSLEEVHVIVAVTNAVRKYQEFSINAARGIDSPDSTGFLAFLSKAKRLISASRHVREFTPYGTLGPVRQASEGQATSSMAQTFSGGDRYILRFMEAWCGLRTFSSSSYHNGIGSAILRATGMYEGSELDQSTGWTFLQEVGVLSPWTNRSAFDLRLPGIGTKMQNGDKKVKQSDIGPDKLAHIRKNWDDLPVYCIDAEGAQEIDDGVSLEATGNPNEFWLHVHSADPASRIRPRSSSAKYAEAMGQNIYFPEKALSMLPDPLVKDLFSLGPQRPCLTFSCRINLQGELLDYKVTSGLVNNVIYITPRIFEEVSGIARQENSVEVTIGQAPHERKGHGRIMTQISELSGVQIEQLKTLYDICKGHHDLTMLRGATYQYNSAAAVDVSLHTGAEISAEQRTTDREAPNSDPSITLNLELPHDRHERSMLTPVAHMMLLAGNVAARWCHERGVPSLFRVSQQNPDKEDAITYFRRVILPLLRLNVPVSQEIISDYHRLLGPVLPSSSAGPHLALGLDMYTKATSPLRRYSDLVVHWQIEATLLEEARHSKSLIGNTRDDFLPFKKSDIDQLVPRLDARERLIRDAQRSAERSWILQALIRAWKFEKDKIPSVFEFIVSSVTRFGVSGRITSIANLPAKFDIPTWLSREDVRIGDRFEVKVEMLNSYTLEANMKALRLLPRVEGNR